MCVILGVDFLDSSHLEVCKGAWHLFVKCPGRFLLALQEPTCQSPTAVCASRSCGAGHDSGRVGPVAAEVPCSGSHDSDSGPWSQTGHSRGQQSRCPVSRQDTDRTPDKVRPVTHPPETQQCVYHGGRAVGAARPVSLSTLCLPPSPTQVALVTDPTREAACVALDLS